MRRIVLAILIIGCIFAAGCGGEDVKQTMTEIYVAEGDTLQIQATDFLNVDKPEKVTIDDSELDTSKAGEYKVLAKYKFQTYELNVIVEKMPIIEESPNTRVIYASDINNIDYSQFLKSVKNVEDYDVKLIMYEKVADEVTSSYIAELEATEPGVEDLSTFTSGVPTEEGVYHAVFDISTKSGSIVLLDKYLVYEIDE